jgi:hypothetical protein
VLWLIAEWAKSPSAIEQIALDKVASLFAALSARFANTVN